MIKIYTPKQWYSLFDCPRLVIDDQGLIWAADEYYKVLFGSPSGKIDYSAGKIYGKGLGYDLFEEPIAYLSTKNGVTEVQDAKQGVFSAPILYIKDNKIYTPEEYCSIFDVPSGYIKEDQPSSGGYSGSSSGSSSGGGHSGSSSGSSSGGGSPLIGILSVVLVLALPALLFNLTKVTIVVAVIYLISAIVVLVRRGAVFSAKNLGKGILNGFLTLVVVYLVLFVITTLWSGYDRAVMNELDGPNEIAAWIAGAGTLLLHFEKVK